MIASQSYELLDCTCSDEENLQPIHVWSGHTQTVGSLEHSYQVTKLQVYQPPPGQVPPKVFTTSQAELEAQSMDLYHYYYDQMPDMTAPTAAQVDIIWRMLNTIEAQVEELGGADNVGMTWHW